MRNHPHTHTEPPLASVFGPYRLIGPPLSGAHASVYRAIHTQNTSLEHFVALKTLHTQHDPAMQRHLQQEADVLLLLKAPNIVRMYQTGFHKNQFYIAMEYIRGTDLGVFLKTYLKNHTFLPIPMAVYIVAEILKALVYLHELHDENHHPYRLIHRDINPANILLGFNGSVVLTDFGISSIRGKHLASTRYTCAGKPGYIAPECFNLKNNATVDHRSDIYSVGTVLYELLTGKPVFQSDSLDHTMQLNQEGAFVPAHTIRPEIPHGLNLFLSACLSKNPNTRFGSARLALASLEPYIPRVVGVSLNIASLLKTYKLDALLKDIEMEKHFFKKTTHRKHPKTIALHLHNSSMEQAIHTLLETSGYRVLHKQTHAHNADVVLVDTESPQFDPDAFNAMFAHTHTQAIIALCNVLNTHNTHMASYIGAYDIIEKPFNPMRLLSSVENVFYTEGETLRNISHAHQQSLHRRLKIACISHHDAFLHHFTERITAMGYEIEVFNTHQQALQRSFHTSFNGIVLDCTKDPHQAHTMVESFRSLPGMDLTPIVQLVEPEVFQNNLGWFSEKRASLKLFTTEPEEIVYTLWHVRSDSTNGRTFARYPCHVKNCLLNTQEGSTVVSVVDVSRGGAMLLYPKEPPPINTSVSFRFFPSENSTGIDIQAKVIRIVSACSAQEPAKICLEFRHFIGASETAWIAYIAQLHASLEQTKTGTKG